MWSDLQKEAGQVAQCKYWATGRGAWETLAEAVRTFYASRLVEEDEKHVEELAAAMYCAVYSDDATPAGGLHPNWNNAARAAIRWLRERSLAPLQPAPEVTDGEWKASETVDVRDDDTRRDLRREFMIALAGNADITAYISRCSPNDTHEIAGGMRLLADALTDEAMR